jgi:superfamily II DNA/RNA helicase
MTLHAELAADIEPRPPDMDATQSAIYAGPCRRRDYVKRGKVERVVQLMRDDLLTADEAGRLLDRLSLSFEAQARIVRDVVAQRP